jgi:cell volume regulation protein A
MTIHEPESIAVLLLVAGVLLAASALLSRIAGRTGVPVVLVFLVVGMLAGSEGLGRIAFEDYRLAFRFGTVALAVILFDGGLNTSWVSFRRAFGPGASLATVGVLLTAALVGVAAHSLGLPWSEAFLLGAVVSSTDAATVFSLLRASGINLRRRLGSTLEVESGLNDPLAVILTLALTGAVASHRVPGWDLALQVLVQIVVGAVLGILVGRGGGALLRRTPLMAAGLYPVVTLAFAMVAFGAATLAHGSGFLSVYVAGLMLGNGRLPHRTGVLRSHDFIAWASQVAMFLMLGLLVFPSNLAAVAWSGLAIGVFLALIARPIAVVLSLLPFRFWPNEVVFLSWVGLRGAVPIVLATVPVLAGLEHGVQVFSITFFVVVTGVLLQGSTVGALARRLRLETRAPSPPPTVEIHGTGPLEAELLSFTIAEPLAVAGVALADVPLPPGVDVVFVIRDRSVIPARPELVLLPGDSVHVTTPESERQDVRLLFGQESGE